MGMTEDRKCWWLGYMASALTHGDKDHRERTQKEFNKEWDKAYEDCKPDKVVEVKHD